MSKNGGFVIVLYLFDGFWVLRRCAWASFAICMSTSGLNEWLVVFLFGRTLAAEWSVVVEEMVKWVVGGKWGVSGLHSEAGHLQELVAECLKGCVIFVGLIFNGYEALKMRFGAARFGPFLVCALIVAW